jgi:hypothetical protein
MGKMIDNNNKIGAIVGLIGAIILLSVGLSGISDARLPTTPDPDIPVMTLYIQAVATIVFSAFGILGSILAFKGNLFGYPCLLVAGIGGIAGTFFPIYSSYAGGFLIEICFMIDTLQYFDLALMLVGGILGLTLLEKRERKD